MKSSSAYEGDPFACKWGKKNKACVGRFGRGQKGWGGEEPSKECICPYILQLKGREHVSSKNGVRKENLRTGRIGLFPLPELALQPGGKRDQRRSGSAPKLCQTVGESLETTLLSQPSPKATEPLSSRGLMSREGTVWKKGSRGIHLVEHLHAAYRRGTVIARREGPISCGGIIRGHAPTMRPPP